MWIGWSSHQGTKSVVRIKFISHRLTHFHGILYEQDGNEWDSSEADDSDDDELSGCETETDDDDDDIGDGLSKVMPIYIWCDEVT